MSSELLSWTQPKVAAAFNPKSPRLWLSFNGLLIVLCLATLVELLLGVWPHFVTTALFLLWCLNIRFGIVRQNISITEDGFRVRNLLISTVYRWSEVEWYQLFPAIANDSTLGSIQIKVHKGKEAAWIFLQYDRTQIDESILTQVLQSKLVGRCIS